jgi:hypothetical protein
MDSQESRIDGEEWMMNETKEGEKIKLKEEEAEFGNQIGWRNSTKTTMTMIGEEAKKNGKKE